MARGSGLLIATRRGRCAGSASPLTAPIRFALIAGLSLVASALLAPAAVAATIAVTTTADDFGGATTGTCSLREAVEAANTNSNVIGGTNNCVAGDSGVFDSPDTITIQAG